MFYSDLILQKKGPLARVWLAAHMERKLSKSQTLQTNIQKSIGAIVDQEEAPMALRLSGQLLLGVVRIYSRKARYLLEDCNEALMRIKMAFCPRNLDLEHTELKSNFMMKDTMTAVDVLRLDPILPDFDLEFDKSIELPLESSTQQEGSISVEIGREAAPPRTLAEEFSFHPEDEEDLLAKDRGDEEPLVLDFGIDQPMIMEEAPHTPLGDQPTRGLTPMDVGGDTGITEVGRETLLTPRGATPIHTPAAEFFDLPLDIPVGGTPIPAASPLAAQPETLPSSPGKTPKAAPRKRKAIVDSEIEISARVISNQLRDTSSIIREPVSLTSGTELLKKSLLGEFAKDIFHPVNVHPSLKRFLNPEFVRMLEKRRFEEHIVRELRLEKRPRRITPDIIEESVVMEESEPVVLEESFPIYPPVPSISGEVLPQEDLPISEELPQERSPLPESQSTLEASQFLATKFEESQVLKFTEATQDFTRMDATKLFFEVLVLATNDKVMVEQKEEFGEIEIQQRVAV